MAEFTNMLVSAEITDLPAAKKGRFAGKKRHDVLILHSSPAVDMHPDAKEVAVPQYAANLLENGKKVVMYKSNKAYEGLVQALFGQEEQGPSIEELMAEAEAEDARREQEQVSNKRAKALATELAKNAELRNLVDQLLAS